jgi:hypothetical protein
VWARELNRMAKRQLLHASDLVFRHPVTDEEMHFRAPLPADFAEVVEWARDETGAGPEGAGEDGSKEPG